MNQRAIAFIIGLTSLAVIGVLTLQIRFINHSIDLNEAQFNKQVLDALYQVVKKVEAEEDMELNGTDTEQLPEFGNGYSLRYNNNNIKSNIKSENYINAKKLSLNKPIEERINGENTKRYIQEELANRGIQAKYNYGIYSNATQQFFYADGYFVIPDPKNITFGFLTKSPYRVNMFPSDPYTTKGVLMLHFPNISTVFWGGLWQSLLLIFFFAAIILGCFAYTIYVIFHQKKLSMMKNDFINNMTHEFKTPIATISLATDSITSPSILTNPDKVKRFADIIRQENKRMNAQVEKVLQAALMEREELNLNLSDINLHDIIEQAVQNAQLQVSPKDGRVQAELRATQPNVEGDITHITNIISNLLDNANKYSPEKPDIKVSTRNYRSGVEVQISDKGIGMSKEARKHIFEKFYRVHTGNRHDVKGFGLGLAYVKTMMLAHKGTVEARSELGKGSTFVLFFPFKIK